MELQYGGLQINDGFKFRYIDLFSVHVVSTAILSSCGGLTGGFLVRLQIHKSERAPVVRGG